MQNKNIYDDLEPKVSQLTDCLLSYKILTLAEKKRVDEFIKHQIKPIKKKQIRIFARENKISYTKILSYFNRCAKRKEKEIFTYEVSFMEELKKIWVDVDQSWQKYVYFSEVLVNKYYYNINH